MDESDENDVDDGSDHDNARFESHLKDFIKTFLTICAVFFVAVYQILYWGDSLRNSNLGKI